MACRSSNIHHHTDLALAATLKKGFRRAVITAQDLRAKLAGQPELIQVPWSTGLDVNLYRPNREQVRKVCVRLCARVRTCRCVCLNVCVCVRACVRACVCVCVQCPCLCVVCLPLVSAYVPVYECVYIVCLCVCIHMLLSSCLYALPCVWVHVCTCMPVCVLSKRT
jgi:hypothetical protein